MAHSNLAFRMLGIQFLKSPICSRKLLCGWAIMNMLPVCSMPGKLGKVEIFCIQGHAWLITVDGEHDHTGVKSSMCVTPAHLAYSSSNLSLFMCETSNHTGLHQALCIYDNSWVPEIHVSQALRSMGPEA